MYLVKIVASHNKASRNTDRYSQLVTKSVVLNEMPRATIDFVPVRVMYRFFFLILPAI